MAFLGRFNKLLWFIILIFKPESKIINFFKVYISSFMYKEPVKQLLTHRINYSSWLNLSDFYTVLTRLFLISANFSLIYFFFKFSFVIS